MSFEQVMGTVQQMMAATDALAAIGAGLSLKEPGQTPDPDVVAALGAVAAAAGLDLDALAPPQQAMVLGIIKLCVAQAADLLREPARPPGWTFTDPLVLEGMGRGSMMIPTMLAAAAPEFTTVTSLLDIGAGVGLLAVSATNVWPTATVVGIDVWEPALERARANVHAAGLDDRITLRNQDLLALDDVDAYDCVWVPTFFIPEKVLTGAAAKIMRSTRTGGWVVFGVFAPPPNPVAQATSSLRTIRSGGWDLDVERASELLRGAGCAAVRTVEPPGPGPVRFVIGQKP